MGGVERCSLFRDLIQGKRMMRGVADVGVPPTMNEQISLYDFVLSKFALPIWLCELRELIVQGIFQSLNGDTGIVWATIRFYLKPDTTVRRTVNVAYRGE